MRGLMHYLIGVILLSAGVSVRGQELVSLERTLVRAAPDIIKYCREHGYKNVGVLKFLAHKQGQAAFSDNVGTLNRLIAKRLELAMIVANSPRDPLGIIENASDVAANTPGANHLTKTGRAKLFDPKYRLAWGNDEVSADAFITGLVDIDEGLKTINIKLLVLDKPTNSLATLGKDLVAANDSRKLSEIGESFSRGAFDDGTIDTGNNANANANSNASPDANANADANAKTNTNPGSSQQQPKPDDQALAKAEAVKEQSLKNPAQDPAAPVKLEVLYDGQPIPIEFRDGKAFIPEPNESQRVTFRLLRNSGDGTYGCVLKVNGENTLFRETQPDAQCHRWLLLPDNKSGIEIVGFQQSRETSQGFRVLSRAESKDHEIDYGASVGTITLTVFGELKGARPPDDLSDETQNTKVVEKAKLPEKKADSFNALSAQLLADANRGLITEGSVLGRKINLTKFAADPTPLMSLTVIYYQKN
jgi:hypothetical protein